MQLCFLLLKALIGNVKNDEQQEAKTSVGEILVVGFQLGIEVGFLDKSA